MDRFLNDQIKWQVQLTLVIRGWHVWSKFREIKNQKKVRVRLQSLNFSSYISRPVFSNLFQVTEPLKQYWGFGGT